MRLERRQQRGDTVKYLWRTHDGHTVESAAFLYAGKIYNCISTQIGCNVGCVFCETGRQRALRNLTARELCEQVLGAISSLEQPFGTSRFDKVVLAGMGEPLLSMLAIREFVPRLLEERLAGSVVVTTAGVAPAIRQLVELDVRLHLSLHATTDEVREVLVPMNKKYPIREVLSACRSYYDAVRRPITANYLLFEDLNDSDQDCERLRRLLEPGVFKIRLRAWNPIDGSMKLTTSRRFDFFLSQLSQSGFDVAAIGLSRGWEIGAGCGQLRSRDEIASAVPRRGSSGP